MAYFKLECLGPDRLKNLVPTTIWVMPRLLPADKCPKCRGPLKRQPTAVGTIFACEKCDADDPIKAADKWIKGELRPPE